MSVHIQPIAELTSRLTLALVQELGIIDAIRFLNQIRRGSGDYTAEREQLFKGKSVKSIVASILAQRSDGE